MDSTILRKTRCYPLTWCPIFPCMMKDVVPDISVHDEAAFVAKLTSEIQPLVPGMQVIIVVDHNYSE